MTDEELVYIYQTERNIDAKNLLIAKYEKLFKYVCFKLLQKNYYSVPIEYQDLDLIIYEAFNFGIDNFDLKQTRYSFKQSMYTISTSYFRHEAKKYTTNRHYVLNNYRDISKYSDSFNDPVDPAADLINQEYCREQHEIIKNILSGCSPLVKKVIYYRSLGYANREIAKLLKLNSKKIANTVAKVKKEFNYANSIN